MIEMTRHHTGCAPVIGLVAVAALPASAVEVTAVFQEGLSGYTRTRDTFVSSLDWDNPPQYRLNYGSSVILALSRDGDDNPLIVFDLG